MQYTKADSSGGNVTQVDSYRRSKFGVHGWGQQAAVPELSSSDLTSEVSSARDLSPSDKHTVKLLGASDRCLPLASKLLKTILNTKHNYEEKRK